MSTEISMNLQRQASHASVVPAGNSAKTVQTAPKVAPIPKVEINFDAERMRQNIQESVSKLNEMMVSSGRGLNFTMDEKLGRPIIYVKNSQTGEVVRQIPNEVVVRIAHGIEDFKGLLHNAIS